jgi:DNA repair photolyase
MSIILTLIAVKTALTKTGGFLYAFTHLLTPYWGCSYGRSCFYCYMGESPIQRLHAGGLTWGNWVKPKVNIAEVLQQELAAFARKGTTLRIFFSGATEPFPPALEPKYRLSGKFLEAVRCFPPALLVIRIRSRPELE